MANPFAQPGVPAEFQMKDLAREGALVAFHPTEVVEGVLTSYGESDATRADIMVIPERAGAKRLVKRDALVFTRKIREALAMHVGTGAVVLLRLELAKTTGGNDLVLVRQHTEADASAAAAVLEELQEEVARLPRWESRGELEAPGAVVEGTVVDEQGADVPF